MNIGRTIQALRDRLLRTSRSSPEPVAMRMDDLTLVGSLRLDYSVVIIAHGLFSLVVLRNAWMSDDSYFVIRTISNFLAGDGLVWNVGERVQAYTHPLWLFVLSAGVFFTNEFFYTSLAISIVIAVVGVVIFARWIASTPMVALLGIATLIVSRAYIDYSTSGLENALSHLLAVIYLAVYFAAKEGRWRVFALFFVAALAGVNRLDLLLVYLPSLIYVVWKERSRATVVAAAAGLLPLVIWEAFSLLYYGFPFPNTAYAKLNTGIPRVEILEQGLYYLLNSALADPITLVVTAAGVLAALFVLRGAAIPIAIGVVLYLVYVVRIGGGFMSGRFLTTTLLVSLALVCRMRLPDRHAIAALGIVVAVGFTAPSPTLLSFSEYGTGDADPINEWGIADERARYFPHTGLVRGKRHVGLPSHPLATAGSAVRDSEVPVRARSASGLFTFYAGRGLHLIDLNGRGDALLARLPAFPDPNWWIGHHERDAPEGYVETVETAENSILDPNLAQYYDSLSMIVSGPVFRGDRILTIVKMNLRGYDYLVDAYVRSLPTSISVDKLRRSLEGGEQATTTGVFIPRDGIRVDLNSPSHAAEIELRLSPSADYQVIFMQAGEELTRAVIRRGANEQVASLRLPPSVFQGGYDAIAIHPANANADPHLYSLEFKTNG